MPIIKVNNISKKYNIVHQKNGSSYITLRDVLTNFAKHPFKSAKNLMKQKLGIGIEEFWALKDINFSVEKGEVLGIIGPNGAGKSTLLKILSQITPPTTGEIKIKGRIGSLLEVGTGFNPELTGRENVYLNGAILGMTKNEIEKKFDKIVEFSGVEKFIDTPVKRYSSGMKVRLGFAVAAHLEPDILLVDEVLAVGDAEFQKKCLGKMDEVTKTAGRTILFVSHNMAAIQNLCKRCVLLDRGKIKMIGGAKEVIEKYLSAFSVGASKKNLESCNKPDQKIKLLSIELKNGMDNRFCVSWTRPIELILEIEVKERVEQACFVVWITTVENVLVFSTRHTDKSNNLWDLDRGKYKILIKIENMFRAGMYGINLRAHSITRKASIFKIANVAQLEISEVSLDDKKYIYQASGIVNIDSEWKIISNS